MQLPASSFSVPVVTVSICSSSLTSADGETLIATELCQTFMITDHQESSTSIVKLILPCKILTALPKKDYQLRCPVASSLVLVLSSKIIYEVLCEFTMVLETF